MPTSSHRSSQTSEVTTSSSRTRFGLGGRINPVIVARGLWQCAGWPLAPLFWRTQQRATIENAPAAESRCGHDTDQHLRGHREGPLAPAAARARPLVYVPNSRSASVTVIDPVTYRVIRTFSTGTLPQHVVPSYDLGTLWVANNEGNSLTPIDPTTGDDGTRVPVDDPHNLYFTPDGLFRSSSSPNGDIALIFAMRTI